jgi:hypothetical protein
LLLATAPQLQHPLARQPFRHGLSPT